MAKLYYIQYIHVCFLSMFHSVAGAGAAEKRGGAGEHPGVRQDEEQPAPDQAGDRRRGADHLKKRRRRRRQQQPPERASGSG